MNILIPSRSLGTLPPPHPAPPLSPLAHSVPHARTARARTVRHETRHARFTAVSFETCVCPSRCLVPLLPAVASVTYVRRCHLLPFTLLCLPVLLRSSSSSSVLTSGFFPTSPLALGSCSFCVFGIAGDVREI